MKTELCNKTIASIRYSEDLNVDEVIENLTMMSMNGNIMISKPYSIELLTGGLSNILYKINDKYVYRKYVNPSKNLNRNKNAYNNDNEKIHHQMMDKISVMVEREMSKLGHAPKIVFERPVSGYSRLEEYIHAVAIPEWEFYKNITDFFPVIDVLHKITKHDLFMSATIHQSTNISIYNPFQLKSKINESEIKTLLELAPNPVYELLIDWLEMEEIEEMLNMVVGEKKLHQLLNRWADRREMNKFKKCFCHNDIHRGNFLTPTMLIDYEYAGYNYELYDWANFCNEMELEMIEEKTSYTHIPKPDLINTIKEHVKSTAQIKIPYSFETDFQFFRNMSHLFWGCWSLERYIKRTNLGNNFDYQRFANLRFSLIQ